MSSAQSLREFINKRLSAAAEEIFTEFRRNIVQLEEEIDRQRRLLDLSWKPQINLHRIELPLHYVWKDEEGLTDQQLCNPERASSLEQEEPEALQEGPEPSQMKVQQDDPEPLQILEQQEFSISQNKEQLVLQLTSFVTPTYEDQDHNEPKPNCDQLLFSMFPDAEIQEQEGSRKDAESGRDEEFKLNRRSPQTKDNRGNGDGSKLEMHTNTHTACPELPQHHVWKKEEILTDQHLSNQEMTFSLDQEEPEYPRLKEEQQELCISRQEEQIALKQENVTFMVNSASEETDCCKSETNSNQPICQISPEPENQDLCKNKNSEIDRHEESKQNNIRKQTEGHGESFDDHKKPFLCKICGKSFRHNSIFIHHMRTHTGEKPFPCVTCGKRFSQKSNLTKHMRTHTGEKPYSCKKCGKCFSQKSNLTKHMKTHTGEKPFPCYICGRRFRKSSALGLHIRSHT
nr:zinc finger protein 37 isoform X1 [Nothobranchius furzeri]